MTWLEPGWWPLLCVGPLVWFALRAIRRRRAAALRSLLGQRSAALTDSLDRGRRGRADFAASAGLALATLALLRPSWGEPQPVATPSGADVLICLDVSRSMLARDTPPDRLTAAKRHIDELAEVVRHGRLGLVAFAGEARLRIPLTRDLRAFRRLVDLAAPHSVRTAGTDIGVALDEAERALESAGPNPTILLLTDGEDHVGNGLAAAERLAAAGITVYAVGYGSELGARIAPSASGDDVVTRLDAPTLRAIAESTGGTSSHADATARPLVALFERHIDPLAQTSTDADGTTPTERFQWLLLSAVLLWIGYAAIAERSS